jgi:hypothetical protein
MPHRDAALEKCTKRRRVGALWCAMAQPSAVARKSCRIELQHNPSLLAADRRVSGDLAASNSFAISGTPDAISN